MAHRVGIDLGTTNSAIAFTELGRQRCVKVEENGYTAAVLPSCVATRGKGTWLIGADARNVPDSASEFKRRMGEDFLFQIGNQAMSPVELSSLVLGKLKEGFEQKFGKIDGAVITVPAMFNEGQRRSTIEAGRLAGLNVLRVINEPSAAAIAYAQTDRPPAMDAVVIDWGGGTLDVSVVDCADSVLDIKANYGDMQLGGKDVDGLLVGLLVDRLKEMGTEISEDKAAMHELKLRAEEIKIFLSQHESWEDPVVLNSRRLFIDFKLTRMDFERRLRPLVDRVFAIIEAALARCPEGKLDPHKVSDVLLVGGSCLLPAFQRRVAEYFGRPGRITVNPMEVVALGAAYQAQYANNAGPVVTVHSLTMNLGVSCVGEDGSGVPTPDAFSCILASQTKIPAKATETYYTVYEDQDEIDVEVFESKDPILTVAGLEPMDSQKITGLPPGKPGSFPIHVTFDYAIDQILTVTVEVPKANIRKKWVSKRERELAGKREQSKKKVDAVLGRSGEALQDILRRAGPVIMATPGATKSRAALDRLRMSLESGDMRVALEAKSDLLDAMFHEGLSLPPPHGSG